MKIQEKEKAGRSNNRRGQQRFAVQNGAFVLKGTDYIRMGPVFDIGFGGFSFCLIPFSGIDTEQFDKSNLSIRIDNFLIDQFLYKTVYTFEKEKSDQNNDRKNVVQFGIQFIDLDYRHKNELENFLGNGYLEIIKDRRNFVNRRTRFNRRKCDLPQYKSGFRKGRDRRVEMDRRNY